MTNPLLSPSYCEHIRDYYFHRCLLDDLGMKSLPMLYLAYSEAAEGYGPQPINEPMSILELDGFNMLEAKPTETTITLVHDDNEDWTCLINGRVMPWQSGYTNADLAWLMMKAQAYIEAGHHR